MGIAAVIIDQREPDWVKRMTFGGALVAVTLLECSDFRIACDDGEPEVTTYTREELSYLRLAYAISIHRSQGSEFGYVVMAVPTTRPNFMLRQLAYTGLTRAKTYCVLISAQSALHAYVENEERVRRVTFLGEMVRNRIPRMAAQRVVDEWSRPLEAYYD